MINGTDILAGGDRNDWSNIDSPQNVQLMEGSACITLVSNDTKNVEDVQGLIFDSELFVKKWSVLYTDIIKTLKWTYIMPSEVKSLLVYSISCQVHEGSCF